MTRKWRAVIADDEPLARRVIRDLLAAEADVSVVSEARSGRDAVEAIRSTKPDLLFIDVDMPDLDGFGVLEAIPSAVRPHSIFVTAYDEFAVRAFEEEALDYLVKPFTDERFRKTLDRARKHLARTEVAQPGSSAPYLDRLPVTIGRRTRWVDLADVAWIEADDYYARLRTRDAVHLVRITLANLEQRLDPNAFARVHRGALVNRAAVRRLARTASGAHVLVLSTGARVKVSGRRVRDVMDWLAARAGSPAST